jgi:hypothetical protein
VRGLGIVRTECARQADLDLVVRLTDAASIERLPETCQSHMVLLDIAVPEIAIDAACRIGSGPGPRRSGRVLAPRS